MEPRVEAEDVALLMMGDDELVALGAMLSLAVRDLELEAEEIAPRASK